MSTFRLRKGYARNGGYGDAPILMREGEWDLDAHNILWHYHADQSLVSHSDVTKKNCCGCGLPKSVALVFAQSALENR